MYSVIKEKIKKANIQTTESKINESNITINWYKDKKKAKSVEWNSKINLFK